MGLGKPVNAFVAAIVAGSIAASLMACSLGGAGRCPRRALALPSGEVLPQLELLPDMQLQQASLSEVIDGKFAVIDIWATWCKPCIRALPHLQAMHNRFADRGVAVVGILVDRNASSMGPEFMDGRGVSYPILFDDYGQEVNCAWGSPLSIPTMLLVDQKGKVVQVFKGTVGLEMIERRLEVMLREADEQPDPNDPVPAA